MTQPANEMDLLILWDDEAPALLCFGVTFDEESYFCNCACPFQPLDAGRILNNDAERVEIIDAIEAGQTYKLLRDVQLGREFVDG